MFQRIAIGLFLFGLALANLGCEKNRESRIVVSPVGSSQTWGVLVYAAGNYSGDVLPEAVNGTLSRAVNTVREMELYYANERIVSYACLSSTESSGDVGIYNIGFHPQTGDGLLGSTLVRNLGPVSTADPSTLGEFLTTALGAIDADHYILCLAGDGDGWFGTMGDQTQPAGIPLSSLRSTLSEFSGELPGGRLDLLCLYSKDMGAIETLIELHDQARFVVTYPWKLEQPHHLIVKQWYGDLLAQPELSADGLGAYVVDAERLAQNLDTDSVFATLWDMDALANIETRFETFAGQWAAVAPQNSQTLISLRNSSTNVGLYDSVYVDLAYYAEQIAAASQFSPEEFDGLRNSATELSAAVLEARTAHIGSPAASQFGGLNFYYPTGTVDTLTAAAYGALRIGTAVPSWHGVIDSLAHAGNSEVTISGKAYWPGHSFYNLNFFADSAAASSLVPFVSFEPEWTALNVAQDTISYSVGLSLEGNDSLTIEFGLFIDRNNSGNFNSGDSLGFWNDGSGGNFTSVTVHRGEILSDRDITVRLRRP